MNGKIRAFNKKREIGKKRTKNNCIAIDVVVCDSHFSLINLRYNN